MSVLDGIDETRGPPSHFEPLVDADKEFRRNDRALNCTKLSAFDLPCDRAQLACRIYFGFDPASGIAFDRRRIILCE